MKRTMTIVASLLLSSFFFCIVLFAMLEVLKLQETSVGIRPFIFAVIDYLIILITLGFGKNLSEAVGRAMYVPIAVSTVVYSLGSLAFNCYGIDIGSTALFTLIDLIMLFVYLCIVIPLAVTGAGREEQPEVSERIKTHNLKDYP